MRLRTIAAVSGIAALAAMGSFSVAHADDLGEFTQGSSINLPYGGCAGAGDDNLYELELEDSIVQSNYTVPEDPGLFNYYTIDTTGLAPGAYEATIGCNGGTYDGALMTHTFTIVAADPCAPEVTVQIPNGPSRAPHAAEECEDIGAMGTPRTASTTLLIGAVALAVGSGLLVIRRHRLA
jgi:hypothetical protein